MKVYISLYQSESSSFYQPESCTIKRIAYAPIRRREWQPDARITTKKRQCSQSPDPASHSIKAIAPTSPAAATRLAINLESAKAEPASLVLVDEMDVGVAPELEAEATLVRQTGREGKVWVLPPQVLTAALASEVKLAYQVLTSEM